MRVGNTNRYLTTTRCESYTLFFERNVNTPLICQTSASAVVGAEPLWIINSKSSIRTVILPDNMLAIVASRTINDHMPHRHHKSLRDLTLWSLLDRPVNLKTNKMSDRNSCFNFQSSKMTWPAHNIHQNVYGLYIANRWYEKHYRTLFERSCSNQGLFNKASKNFLVVHTYLETIIIDISDKPQLTRKSFVSQLG